MSNLSKFFAVIFLILTIAAIYYFFNAKAEKFKPFQTFDPITFFFSDGTRRFFIFNRASDPSTQTRLAVIPFDTQAWGMQAPQILSHPLLQTVERFFWVQPIGMSGLVLAGTEKGVVGLE